MGIVVQHIASWIVGLTFIFSGFVKSVDPVGTSIFVEKYLATYGLEVLMPAALTIGVVLGAVELLLGLMLISGAYRRVASLGAVLFLIIFTIITLLSATILPIGDCGCFGDAVTLTPWQTFGKNLLLLPLSIVAWRLSCRHGASQHSAELTVVFALLALMLNLVSLRFQPLVDFLPYKVGVDLRKEVERVHEAEANQVVTYLSFRDTTTGELHNFPLDDKGCWMDANLEYVGDYTEVRELEMMQFADFKIYSDEGDATLSLLEREGRVLWLTVSDVKALKGSCLEAVRRVLAKYPGQVAVITSDSVESVSSVIGVPCYAIDAMTLRSLIRSTVGVVVVDDGVIMDKWNIRDFRE